MTPIEALTGEKPDITHYGGLGALPMPTYPRIRGKSSILKQGSAYWLDMVRIPRVIDYTIKTADESSTAETSRSTKPKPLLRSLNFLRNTIPVIHVC